MAKHEFGIMNNKPMNKERFDEYNPNKHNASTLFKSFLNAWFFTELDTYLMIFTIPYKSLLS